jgi:hypothetical protein
MRRLRVEQRKEPIENVGAISKVGYTYRVMQVINAVKPKIGDRLSEAELNDFCVHPDWEVTIK